MSARTIALVNDLTLADREVIADLGANGSDREASGFVWDDFLSRVERYLDVELPTQMDDPVITLVQRLARASWREAND